MIKLKLNVKFVNVFYQILNIIKVEYEPTNNRRVIGLFAYTIIDRNLAEPIV